MFSAIKRVFVLLLVLVAGAAIAEPGRSILVVGDSLSAGYGIDPATGWVALLQDRLDEQGYGYQVVNASISGDTTGGGLRRLPRALQLHQPDIVVIELGGNDGLRGTPIFAIRSNLARMIELSQEAGAAVLLAGMQMPPNYGSAYTGAFIAMYEELADKYDTALIPFFMEDVALDDELMQPDGIHPNVDGQPVLLNNTWPVLEKLLQDQS